MHLRERGAAHINIFWFVIALVLFLGALAFGYLMSTERNEFEKRVGDKQSEIDRLKGDVQIRNQLIAEIKKILPETGEFKGSNWEAQGTVTPEPLQNVPSPEKIRKSMTDFAAVAGVTAAQAAQLDTLLIGTRSELEKARANAENADKERATALAESSQLRQAQEAASTAAKTAAQEATQKSEAVRAFFEEEFKKRDTDLTSLRSAVERRQEELNRANTEHTAALLKSTKEKDTLLAQNNAMMARQRMTNAPDQADGRVISSSQVAGRAYIDLGRKDMLPVGTVFKITAPGKTETKAMGRVTKIEQNRAEIEVTDLKDRYDPVVQNDQIYNALYTPGVKRNIVLLGRFSYPLRKDDVKRLLEQLGNRVVDKVAPGVDMAIIGSDTITAGSDGFTDIAETDEYKALLSLGGVEIVPLNKVREFLRVSE